MTNQTDHAEAILRAAVPVAWLYRRHDKVRIDHSPELSDDMMPGWEAEPLYPASAILDAVREAMAQEWHPIEIAPKDGASILALWLWNGVGEIDGSQSHEVVRWCGWWDANGFTRPDPTHWIPLPAPPQRTHPNEQHDKQRACDA